MITRDDLEAQARKLEEAVHQSLGLIRSSMGQGRGRHGGQRSSEVGGQAKTVPQKGRQSRGENRMRRTQTWVKVVVWITVIGMVVTLVASLITIGV